MNKSGPPASRSCFFYQEHFLRSLGLVSLDCGLLVSVAFVQFLLSAQIDLTLILSDVTKVSQVSVNHVF